MSFPQYFDTLETDIHGLCKLPRHWRLSRLRHLADINPPKSEVSQLSPDLPVTFLPMEAIGEDGTLNLEQSRSLADVTNGYTYFRDGDVAVAKITPCFENGKGAVMRGLCNGIGFGTTELIVARPNPDHITSDYLHWLFVSTYFRRTGESSMYGAGGQKRVPDDFVRNFCIGLPPLPEQHAIASFLDRETAKIDALVAEQRRLIELLKEKRQAVISHAVTKGLDPTVPMKDSGIEWLGEVPEHWEVVQLKRVIAGIESGTSVNAAPEPAGEGQIGVLKTSSVYSGAFDPSENKTVDHDDLSRVSCPLKANALIVSRMNTPDLVGAAGLVTEVKDNIFLPDRLWQVEFDDCTPRFVYLWTLSSLYRWQIKSVCTGTSSSMKNLTQDQFNDLIFCCPSALEQQAIVQELDVEMMKLDSLIAEGTHAITLLQERRTALISAAVTGKIDVREHATQETA